MAEAVSAQQAMEYVGGLRAQRKVKEKEADDLKKQEAAWTDYIHKLADQQGVKGFRGEDGFSCGMRKDELVTIGDSDVFFDWVREQGRLEFLQKRVAKSVVLEFMGDEEEREDPTSPGDTVTARPKSPPPGVNYSSKRKMIVTIKGS